MTQCIAPRAILMRSGQCIHNTSRKFYHSCVKSRYLLRCDEGRGKVIVNGDTYELFPRAFLFLPWGHSIRYQPDQENPFKTTGAHVVPDYEQKEEKMIFAVPHGPGYEYFDSQNRQDVSIPGLDGVISGILGPNAPLSRLLDYIVSWFSNGDRQEEDARYLGKLLLNEVIRYNDHGRGIQLDLPKHLWEVIRYIENYLDTPLPIEKLTEIACCSRASLFRQFKQHLKLSPTEWIIHRRIEFACNLLQQGNQRVSDVGNRVGISNPHYFSRIFKKVTGLTPSGYKKHT